MRFFTVTKIFAFLAISAPVMGAIINATSAALVTSVCPTGEIGIGTAGDIPALYFPSEQFSVGPVIVANDCGRIDWYGPTVALGFNSRNPCGLLEFGSTITCDSNFVPQRAKTFDGTHWTCHDHGSTDSCVGGPVISWCCTRD